ncbi:MAG: type II toxin-antitoxin system RelE/ParE family toxin [Oscillospiraceae bacterium]|jgi:hypothetical protein|nr:type II toxin-antitoxin system RelE/ParE family toxin [Oscillospiraceae bacterium]
MAFKKYRVLVDPQADRKLSAHVEFLARVSETAAVRIYQLYEEALVFLGNNPESCPIYTPQKPIDTQLRYWLFGERYRIVFEIIDNTAFSAKMFEVVRERAGL